MGNTPSSADKPGFYTPTPNTDSRPITPSINEIDEEITTRIMTSQSPDMDTDDTVTGDISIMLAEIASEIDVDYKTNTTTIRMVMVTITLLILVQYHPLTNSLTPIPISPIYVPKKSTNMHMLKWILLKTRIMLEKYLKFLHITNNWDAVHHAEYY